MVTTITTTTYVNTYVGFLLFSSNSSSVFWPIPRLSEIFFGQTFANLHVNQSIHCYLVQLNLVKSRKVHLVFKLVWSPATDSLFRISHIGCTSEVLNVYLFLQPLSIPAISLLSTSQYISYSNFVYIITARNAFLSWYNGTIPWLYSGNI